MQSIPKSNSTVSSNHLVNLSWLTSSWKSWLLAITKSWSFHNLRGKYNLAIIAELKKNADEIGKFSCLDILADYLRGRRYAYERIDGSVPGDQRQAAIDRFTTLPIEESFVFLLCTRAGGVGINLTASIT